MTLAAYNPSEHQLRRLIRDLGDSSSAPQLVHTLEISELVASAAFEHDDEHALDDAHRSLFELYALVVWNPPPAPLAPNIERALHAVRDNLERAFRESLNRRRDGHLGTPPAEASELAAWFTELATGPHPHDIPRWPSFVRDNIALDQLKEIASHRSLFFLREPDPWIYAVPALTGVAKAGLLDLLLDEYGWGKLDHMHSTVYARLMAALELETERDFYEEVAPWQFLATQNHQWMLALTPSLSRQLLGTIYLTEADSPAAMANYLAAWERLEVTDADILHFYELHVTADVNHRDVALHEVLIPTCGDDLRVASEIALGIFDGKTVEADYAKHLLARFEQSLSKETVSAALDRG